MTREHLTRRQREILYLRSCGFDRRWAAAMLGCSVKTVAVQLDHARIRLNTPTTESAIAEAIRLRLIP